MGSLGYQVEDDLDVVNGHKELPNDYKGLANGINGIHINGHVEPTLGRGRPNQFYPIDGVYPGLLPQTTGQRRPLKIA